MAITSGQKATYLRWRERGDSIATSSRKAGFSVSTGERYEKVLRIPVEWSASKEAGTGGTGRSGPGAHHLLKAEAKLPGPIPLERLGAEAKRALEDFDYFRRRYFGRISMPWQLLAIEDLVRLLHTEEREFVDLNEPPGSGKSTLLSDFKCWLICRDRTVRMLTGSATAPLARKQLMRVRRSLERTIPLKGDPKEVMLGIALDAESTLARDYGRFKPLDKELWNQDAFIVMQHEGTGAIEDKEATLTAYGIDSEFTGGRFNYVEWDDLVSPSMVSSASYREGLEFIYVRTCEPRVEPEGLMVLSGQRLASDDLHRFALDLVQPQDDDEDEIVMETAPTVEEDRSNMKYRHIVFKAHYEDRCQGMAGHSKKAAPYPDGCLLDPRRLPWRDLVAAQSNGPSEFALVYQQEDADPDESLVQRHWVYGDDDHIGCADRDRGLWEIPEDISYHDCIVFACCDPSPSMYWSVQCYIWHEPSKRLILLDHVRRKMKMPEMLDRNAAGVYSGLMDEWQTQSERMGFPISSWVIEYNAAQRWMLQQSLFHDWLRIRGVEARAHTTTLNKLDKNYGVWSLQPYWRLGRVRLPMKHGEASLASMKLIEEVVAYPHGRTDDCVMAQWIGVVNIDQLTVPEDTSYEPDRPAWVLEAAF